MSLPTTKKKETHLNNGDEEKRNPANHEGDTKKPSFPTAMQANEK